MAPAAFVFWSTLLCYLSLQLLNVTLVQDDLVPPPFGDNSMLYLKINLKDKLLKTFLPYPVSPCLHGFVDYFS